MDCKDLMIGDLVYIHEPECKGHRIDSIDELDGQVGADSEVYDECDIRPIPLTEEILVKNGFRYTTNAIGRHNCKCYELEQEGVYHMTISIYKNEITCELDKVDAMYMNVVTNYVNTLQHLLRLCGIDKELVIDELIEL